MRRGFSGNGQAAWCVSCPHPTVENVSSVFSSDSWVQLPANADPGWWWWSFTQLGSCHVHGRCRSYSQPNLTLFGHLQRKPADDSSVYHTHSLLLSKKNKKKSNLDCQKYNKKTFFKRKQHQPERWLDIIEASLGRVCIWVSQSRATVGYRWKN